MQIEALGSLLKVRIAIDGGPLTDEPPEGFEVRADVTHIKEKEQLLSIDLMAHTQREIRLDALELSLDMPLVDIHGVVTPTETAYNITRVVRSYEAIVGGAQGIPFVAFVDRAGETRLSIGLLDCVTDTVVNVTLDEAAASYRVTFRKPPCDRSLTRKKITERIYIALIHKVWPTMIARYLDTREQGADTVEISPSGRDDKSCALPIPPAAWEPAYSTHHSAPALVDSNWSHAQARLAAGLGMRTFILDGGWSLPASHSPGRVWEPSKDKFPDFGDFVTRVRKLDMNMVLHAAPFVLGTKSPARKELREFVTRTAGPNTFLLCAQSRAVHEHIIKTMEALVNAYGLDGFQIALPDGAMTYACRQPHAHDYETAGEGLAAFAAGLSERLRKVNPDLLIEFHQKDPNPCVMSLGTMCSAPDAPCDFDTARFTCGILKAVGGELPVHSAPAHWHVDERDENVARHMIGSVFFVPRISVDLMSMRESHRRIVERWLAFWRNHLGVLGSGKFTQMVPSGLAPFLECSDRHVAIVGCFSRWPRRIEVPPRKEIVFLLNASHSNTLLFARAEDEPVELTVYDQYGAAVRSAPSLGASTLTCACPIGGHVELRTR